MENPSDALLKSLTEITGMFDRQRQDESTPAPEITTKRTPEGTFHTVDNLSDQDMHKIMDVLKSQAQIVDAYQKEIGRIESQQKSMNPILNVLATVGRNLAMADKRLPPVVQALGASARQLNPTRDELTDRKLGLLRDVAGIQGREATLAEASLRLQEERRQFDVSESRRQQEEERRVAADKAKLEHEDKMATFAQKKLEVEERMKAAAIDSAEKRQAERDKTLIEAAEIRERAMMQRFTASQEAAARKAAGKEMEVPKTVPEKLANLSAAEKSLDNIEAKIRKFSPYQGVVAGRTIGPAKAYFDRELSKFYTNLKLEVAQTIKSTGAGARGFGPMERGFFERLATAKDHSPEENLGVIDAWRQYIQQNRSAYADVYKGLADPKYKKAFGKDHETIFGVGGEDAETETRRKDPQGNWWNYKDGRWQKE